MIEQSIVHLPDLIKDIDRPVSIYLMHLSSTEHAPRERLGVPLPVSCGAPRLQPGRDLGIARDPGAAAGSLVVLGPVRRSGRVQHYLRGGVPVSGRALAQDGRGIRTLQLDSQRRTLRLLPRPPALGHTEL